MKFFKKLLKEIDNLTTNVTSITEPSIERQFINEVRLRKELNSEHLWRHYYVPLTVKQVLKENDGNISPADNKKVEYLAHSLMFKDMAYGKLSDYLYELNESEV